MNADKYRSDRNTLDMTVYISLLGGFLKSLTMIAPAILFFFGHARLNFELIQDLYKVHNNKEEEGILEDPRGFIGKLQEEVRGDIQR